MSIVNTLRKTIRYGQKNGWRPAFYTALERVRQRKEQEYTYRPVPEQELLRQRDYVFQHPYKISILVPTYETKPAFLRALIDSVMEQTYPHWELILADASTGSIVKNTVSEYEDERIHYEKLQENGGISVNTNQAMKYATGEYCALLDHDDLLTPDALFEMAFAIEKAKEQGIDPAFLYSDEDKCDTDAKIYFDPHYKLDFNYELLLTNNYICHFLVIKTELLQQTGFRKQYDGAQDFDLVLRLVKAVRQQEKAGSNWQARIIHIPGILYHWRCHMNSTADNPESKMYAYEAGRMALKDYYQANDIACEVEHGMHLGFYQTVYQSMDALFCQRKEVGATGGLLVHKRKITGGAYTEDGTILYRGICKNFAGYMNRLHLAQNVDAVDIRCMRIPKRWEQLYQDIVGVAYQDTLPAEASADVYHVRTKRLPSDNHFSGMSEEEIRQKSIAFCKAVRAAGEEIVLNPLYRIKI